MFNEESQKGSILIVALVICALLSLSAVSTFYHTEKILSLGTEEVHSSSSRIKAEYAGISDLISEDLSNGSERFIVIANKKDTGKTEIERRICLLADRSLTEMRLAPFLIGTELADSTRFPIIDFNSLFAKALNCSSYTYQGNQYSGLGFKLSLGSSVSLAICSNSSFKSGKDFIVSSNIEVSKESIDLISGIDKLRIVAAPGYVDLNSKVTVSGDVLIAAGGDLHITELEAALGSTARVSLVSATGAVVVDKITGTPKLKASAWMGISLPVAEYGAMEELFADYQPKVVLGLCRSLENKS